MVKKSAIAGLKRNSTKEFIESAETEYGKRTHGIEKLSRAEIIHIRDKYKLALPAGTFLKCRIDRGEFDLSKLKGDYDMENEEVVETEAVFSNALPKGDFQSDLIPAKDKQYVPWGNYKDVKKIVESKVFAPVFITGLSGNGKTSMVEQVCANTGREYIRVNITIETDEDDLMGGFRLVNGETKWFDGPVPVAMERGAVLLIDEIDLGGNRLMCLQPVLEGKPIYMKKVNRMVIPKAGFTIVATANTKGKSDDTGNFIGTNVLNEAFLDRFKFTMMQHYPNKTIEKNILTKIATKLKMDKTVSDEFIAHLIVWAQGTRNLYHDGELEDVITTRRLVNILESFKIFGTKKKAIQMCLERFDDHTKQAYVDFYKKLDEGADPFDEKAQSESTDTDSDE